MVKCKQQECGRDARYGDKEDRKALFCKDHKDTDMVSVVGPKCEGFDELTQERCNTTASFGTSDENKKRFCKTHKDPDMINLAGQKCSYVDPDTDLRCSTQPKFGRPDEKERYCDVHRDLDMENLNCTKCCYVDPKTSIRCSTQPSFGRPGEKDLFCGSHKDPDMVDVTHHKCEQQSCMLQPTFNYETEKRPRFCEEHAEEGMINIIRPYCSGTMPNGSMCPTTPSFGWEADGKKLCCKSHKAAGMVHLNSLLCPFICDDGKYCHTLAIFAWKADDEEWFCDKHKTPGMVDVKNKHCINDWCDTQVSNKAYEGYCFRCFILQFPDRPVAFNYKTKEKRVQEYITEHFPELTVTSDKKVWGGCSRRRPDIFIDMGPYAIIVEIDEDQHSSYDTTCEHRRLMELHEDVGHKDLVFIRFNPDGYKNAQGVKIPSCWHINSRGLCVLKQECIRDWNNRLRTLRDRISYWEANTPDKTLTLEFLYFTI
jgi:hypothetical protein